MMKKLVVLLACFGLTAHLTACSLFSSDNKSDAEVQSADVDSADLEKLEGDEALQATNDNSMASDQLPEDALGETTPKAEPQSIAAAPAPAPETSAPATAESLAPAQPAANDTALPSDPFAENAATQTPPATSDANTTIVDSGTPAPETSAMTTSEPAPAPVAEKKPTVALQKVANAPWKVGKTWYNTVYFARPGDSLASISQMIYGADKTAELKKGNPSLKNRAVKPGDKVYYNSPHRPDDSARMVTYYEDNGMQPDVYVAKSGDNIRNVSKKLLGYSNAWKEVWATNAVESKGAMPEGTELHYWKGGNVAAAPAAPAHEEMPPVPNQEIAGQAPQVPAPPAPPQQAAADIPPPPPMPEAQAPQQQPPQGEMAPPPPPDMAQNQQMAPPPPPPPVEAVNPPPPPPPAPKKAHHVEEQPAGGMDNDTTLALAVVGLAAAGLAGLIVMRKKRKQKEAEQQAMDNTHVGT